MFKCICKKIKRDELEKLMGDNMVSFYFAGYKTQKAHYRVTPENLLDFIENFVLK